MGKIEISDHRGRFNEYFSLQVRDPIWNSIPITDLEHKIIQLSAFNRLNEINQMGVAWITFPNARHCRFNHSLGVMYVADFLLRNILYINRSPSGEKDEIVPLIKCKFIDYSIWQCFRIAALCHDIGHPPLSHVVEEGLRKNPQVIPSSKKAQQNNFIKSISGKRRYSHEEATKYKLKEGDLFNLIQEEIGDKGLRQLPLLAIGEATEFPYNLLNPIINSDLDADKLDYLKRDGFQCGFYTTYDLNDFEGAIYLSIDSESDNTQPIQLVNKEKIGAVNAFLYSRYREITEVHYEPEVRKATQIAIDLLVRKLNEIGDENKKKDFIIDLHMKSHDSDFWNSMQNLGEVSESAEMIRRCNSTEYKEIQPWFNKNVRNTLDFEDLTPKQRLLCHTIMCLPQSITTVQTKLRKETDDASLLVDFRTAKPPQFSLYVKVRDKIDIPLFHISDTAKGILRDSISYLVIYFYSKNEDLYINVKDILKIIQDTANDALITNFKNCNSIFSHLLILLTIGTVLQHASQTKGFTDPWIIGQLEIQKMIEYICGPDHNPYDHSSSYSSHPKFIRDIETLITMGLVVERRMIINFPLSNKNNSKEEEKDIKDVNYINIPRNNYQFSIYGQEYYNELLSFNKNTKVSKEIKKFINNVVQIQENCSQELEGINNTSAEIEKNRAFPNSDFLGLQNERMGYRKNIREKHGCLVATKYD